MSTTGHGARFARSDAPIMLGAVLGPSAGLRMGRLFCRLHPMPGRHGMPERRLRIGCSVRHVQRALPAGGVTGVAFASLPTDRQMPPKDAPSAQPLAPAVPACRWQPAPGDAALPPAAGVRRREQRTARYTRPHHLVHRWPCGATQRDCGPQRLTRDWPRSAVFVQARN